MANKPNNPALWSRAKSMAKSKFDVYPSAYANGWAAKWYKSKGGTWRKAEYGMEVMGDGGTPDNPGFKALPPAVQQKIMDNMAEGGEKMPPEIARARFAAAGNLDKMGDYGYAYGGYIPEMMYGGFDYMEEGGEPNGGMALGQMTAVADKMSKLRQFVSPEQNLDPWIASKLAVIDDSVNSISDYMMYNPEAQGEGGEEEMGEQYEQEDEEEMMANGGYVVTRSNDRKGKTHKVTGPDGTVKYFGDSKLGQHPKDPERKAAFYARHKKNLENNPFFRAFARKTWKEGGSTFSGNAFYQAGGFIPEYDMSFPADYAVEMMEQGGIHLDPSKKGTFKAQATRMGMGVQEAASTILNAPEGKYSPAMRKKANFAKNFAKQAGGPVEGEVLDVSPEELDMLRQQGYQFEIM
jgi:hypothetical protein